MRDALLWSIERLSAHEEASRWLEGLLATLYFYWYMSRGPNDGRSEGRVLSERALAAARATSDQRALAISLFALGSQAMWSELPEAVMWMEESSGLWRKLGDQHRLGLAKMLAGITALRRGHGDDADRHLVEAADLLRRVHDMPALGVVMMHRGDLANARGDLTEARAHLVEALAIQRQSGGGWTTAAVLNSLGELERAAGDHAAAGEHYREALARFSAVRAPNDVTRSIHALGYVALRAGDSAAARRRFETAKSRFAQAHNRRGLAEATFGLAGVHASDGEWEQAARLIGAADRALEEVGVQPWPADARERERDLARIAAAIGERALQRELTAGREMGLTQYLST